MCFLAAAGFLICCHEVASYHGFCFLFLLLSDRIPVETILHRQKVKMLPVDRSEYQRIVVRRKHLWEDALRHFRSGINFQKYIRITFVGEPAVDDGGPLREFLHHFTVKYKLSAGHL